MVSEDSRLTFARHLTGAILRWKKYKKRSQEWNHDHCSGCWREFADDDRPDVLHEGYTTTAEYVHGEDYHWLCQSCFDFLKDKLGLRIAEVEKERL